MTDDRAPTVECPQCHQPAGRPHTDYCTLAPGKVWDGVLPAPIRLVDTGSMFVAVPANLCWHCGLPDGDHKGGCPATGEAPQPGAPG